MSQVLYRKYRPANFGEVLGQDHIVSVLENEIKNGKISHAYLFAGTRGTGKTSVARIFAKTIGIENEDIYEIDAASNNSVDEMRLLTEAVNTLPFRSKYKIYILDEVHMLSKSAWNAFLKTLEEPPSHVIFILATTELEKVIETVISRCETFQFKKPSQKVLKETVLRISKKEGFSLEQSSADLIALLGDGSFRDTLGILQKVINASSDKKILAEEVEKVTGAPNSELVNKIISAIDAGDLEKGLTVVKEVTASGADIKVFAELILWKLRAIFLLRYTPSASKDIQNQVSETDFVFLQSISKNAKTKINSSVLLAFLDASDAIARAHIPELPLELALIKLLGVDK